MTIFHTILIPLKPFYFTPLTIVHYFNNYLYKRKTFRYNILYRNKFMKNINNIIIW